MIHLKRLIGMFLIVTLSLTMMVWDASAGEPGIISTSVGTETLFENLQANHFHFQKASEDPDTISITLKCEENNSPLEPGSICPTEHPGDIINLTDDSVEECIDEDSRDLYCTATKGIEGRVNFSATFEHE